MSVSCVSPTKWRAGYGRDLVKTALRQPHGSPRLSELARRSRNAVIVTCDKTRGVPSHITIPSVLDELRAGGMELDRVRVLIATGLHKDETMNDVKERLGGELMDRIRISIHSSDDQDQLVFLGRLSSGVPLYLNKEVAESDLVVVEGTVEPHFFAGFTGGSKIILPGATGTETISGNHCSKNIDDSRSRYGVLKNPIRMDADEAIRYLKNTFSLNLVLDSKKRIVLATAGHIIDSFRIAARQVAVHSRVRIKSRPDVVITTNGGYPLDRNIYQCVKGIAVPEQVLHPGSKIIMIGECTDGVGGMEFEELVASNLPSVVYERLRQSGSAIPAQWEAQVLSRILSRNPVWFVTRSELRSKIQSMHMHYAETIEEAVDSAEISEGDHVLAVTDGPSSILTL